VVYGNQFPYTTLKSKNHQQENPNSHPIQFLEY
jgi:hypothetical protein